MGKKVTVPIDNTIAQIDKVMQPVIADVTEGRVDFEYDDVVRLNDYECRDSKGNRIAKEEWKVVHERFSEPEHLLSFQPFPGAVVLHDDSAWGDIGGEQFTSGFVVWNSEVDCPTVGVET